MRLTIFHIDCIKIVQVLIHGSLLASQLWLLGRVLPYEIGKYIPKGDKHWQNYLLLLKVCGNKTNEAVRLNVLPG